MTGKWPSDCIDHINHDRKDNRWENLREASLVQNFKNQKLRKTNTSGYLGISWSKRTKKWKAQIMVNRKNINLGRFDKIEDAIKARKEANTKYDFHPNHGK